MSNSEQLSLLYRIAKYYYLEDKSQQEISEMENISRSQISRLLSRAKEEGIIRFEIEMPIPQDQESMSDEIRELLDLKKVILIPSKYENKTINYGDDQYRNLAVGASDYINELIGDSKVIGVGWGKTMYLTSIYLKNQVLEHDSLVVPLIGVSGYKNPYLQINTIVDRFSEKLNADPRYVNSLALSEKKWKLNDFEKVSHDSVKKHWKDLDVAFISVGPSPKVAKTLIYEFSTNYIRSVKSSRVVGDILSQFYFRDGEVSKVNEPYELFAFPIDQLREVKEVVVIASGSSKVVPLISAARSKYYKTLITDYDTAREILSYIKSRKDI